MDAIVLEAYRRRRAERDAKYTAARLAPPPLRPSERELLEELVSSDVAEPIRAVFLEEDRAISASRLIAVSVAIVPDDPEDVAAKMLEADLRDAGAPEATFTIAATPRPSNSTFAALGAISRAWAPEAAEVLARFAALDLADVALDIEFARQAMNSKDGSLRKVLAQHGVPHRGPPSQHPKIAALIVELWTTLEPVMKGERARWRTIANLLAAGLPGWVGTWQTVRLVIKPRPKGEKLVR